MLSIHLIYFTFQIFVYFITIRGIEISYGFENTCAVDTFTTNFFLLLLSLTVHVNRNQLHTRYAIVMCGNARLPIPNIGFEYLKCCEAKRKMWYLSLSCSDFPIKIVLSFRFSSIRSPSLIIRFCHFCFGIVGTLAM